MTVPHKLTIILTLKDRTPFTFRWMRYMNDKNCPHRILIADGGKDGLLEQELANHGNYPNLNYEYIRYPFDSSLRDYFRKMENAISRVQSDYLLLADNDDFYLLDRISELLDHLDANPDFVGARGQVVNLTLLDGAGEPTSEIVGRGYTAISNYAPSIDADSALERVDIACRSMSKHDYYMNWYCIYKSSTMKEVWRQLIQLPVGEMIVVEILTHVITLMEGKVAVLDAPFYVRQGHTTSTGDQLVAGNHFLERCVVNNALSDFRVAIERMTELQSREDQERVLHSIASWLEVFVANIYWQRVQYENSRIMRFRRSIKHMPFVGVLASKMYYGLAHHLSKKRRRKMLRIKDVEPYILST